MGGEEDDKKSHFTNNTPYEKHLEKYLKYKAKYLNLKNRETFTNNIKFPQNGGTDDKSNVWENENNWTNKGAFKKCMELVQHIGHPNYVSHNKNMIESVKWQKELDVQNFTFGSINEPIVITGVNIKKNDIIVADQSGVVCIPKELITKTLNLLKKISKQEEILEDQVLKNDVQDWDKL